MPHIFSFTVDKCQVLLATVHARKEPLQYILEDSVKVNNIKIMSLHTLFVSDYLQISSSTLEHQDIREAQALPGGAPGGPAYRSRKGGYGDPPLALAG